MENFEYKGKKYFLGEVIDPNPITEVITYDMIVIYEIVGDFEKFEFVNWFMGTDESDEKLIEIAKEYIDRSENGYKKVLNLANEFRKTWYDNINDEKNFYKVEDAEHELLDTILDKEVII